MEKVNITTIGGGTGSINILLGIKHLPSVNIASIVTMADSGGSAWELRDEFGILPPGDVRRAISALAANTDEVRQLFEHRFSKSRIKGHTIGNLLLTGLAEMKGSFEEAITTLCRMFDVRGKVIPVTLDDVHLEVTLEDGSVVLGETNIDIPLHDGNLRITEARLTSAVTLNPQAREVIEQSDYIVIGPGDLYTSIIPNLLVPGMREALEKTNARIIYICNIMTKYGETAGFSAVEFIAVLEQYIGKWVIDFVVLNNGLVRADIAAKYLETEGKIPVIRDMLGRLGSEHYEVVERDLMSASDFARHDPVKLGRLVVDFIEGWIK